MQQRDRAGQRQQDNNFHHTKAANWSLTCLTSPSAARQGQICYHPGICTLRSAFLVCQHLMGVSGGARKGSRKIDL